MPIATDDLRFVRLHPLSAPVAVINEFPCSERGGQLVAATREAVHDILRGADDRLVIVIGPCSVHDPEAALDYAERLADIRRGFAESLEIIMRVYFEKPRTTIGWKGLINDPGLDGSFDIDRGLRIARRLLLDMSNLGVPAGCEFLDTTTPQYISDLVAWAAIGARTTESQVHRELASGVSCPVGFKNGTDGNVRIAIDAVVAAAQPHHFMAITKDGHCAIASTAGNPDCHVILRGGKTPNYDAASVEAASTMAIRAGLIPAIMIDASHSNSGKNAENQPLVAKDVAKQIEGGDRRIMGLMLESNLTGGRQDLLPGEPLIYGCSITDACIDWPTSVMVLEHLASVVENRRCSTGVVRCRKPAG